MDRVVAVSDDLADSLYKIGIKKQKIEIVPNGVSGRFKPGNRVLCRQKQDLPEKAFIVLFVGLFVPVKGLDVLIDALSKWRTETDWKCVLVGDGPEKADIVDRILRHELNRQFVFAGRQPVECIPAWMQSADVLVLPSRSEGRPNVAIEAQACGIPVVATRVGGTAEIVMDGKTGVLVDPENSDALENALRIMKRNENLRLEMGKRANEFISEQGFTWKDNAEKLNNLYRKLLEEKV